MRFYEIGTIILVVFVVVCGGIGYLAHKYTGEDDTPVEEFCEDLLEQELNLPEGTIDFTPSSKETKKKART